MDTSQPSLPAALAARLGAELVETHISWVLLAGDFAYKLKKPLRLPFLDYSTPQRRKHFCEEELRLNQRLAPSLYLGVSAITGSAEAPGIDGPGPVLDWAVRMRRFPPGALFSERVAAGALRADDVDRLAERIAEFHQAAAPVFEAPPGPSLSQRALAALDGCAPLLGAADAQRLRQWLQAQAVELQAHWQARREQGHVRECHGDLHLDNLLVLGDEVTAFDAIEFDASLRCIDVLDDAAFTLMDFAAHGAAGWGWRFLNGWLDRTGEHEALPALRHALVYRALVRAQVSQLRAPGGETAHRYVRGALGWIEGGRPRLAITHGLPGSGKTFQSQRWLEREGAIRLRSDVERKRLFGLGMLESSRAHGLDLYTPEAGERTYRVLLEKARSILRAGWPVVLDAAFLRANERAGAQQLAHELGVPFGVLDCQASLPVLRERLAARTRDASEADAQVLQKLHAVAEPLTAAERHLVLPLARAPAA